MVHSVELIFDRGTEEAIRRIWDGLTETGVKSLASNPSPSNRPHTTVTVAKQMDIGVNAALRALLEFLPFDCTIGAPMLFGSRAFTLVRLLVPSAQLLALHARAHDICLPFMPGGPLDHAAPGQWTPHVTLARRVPPAQLSTALSLRSLGRDVRGAVTGVRHWDGDNHIEYPIN
jgi:2'-5' RNA ligase superfamily protein